jgi:hypothetical protein
MINTNPIVRIRRSAVPGKKPTVDQILTGELGLNTYDANLYTLRNRPGIGQDIVNLGAGSTVTNILYVTEDGNDSNTGEKLGDAKRTIESALAESTTGTVIKVSAGSYLENNPLIIPEQVSIVGDSLREVSISPQNPGEDLFYVANGNYVAEMSYLGTLNPGKAIFSFNPKKIGYFDQSPYIQNCTNFIPNSIGMKIDGNNAIGPLKSMVVDSYTQYNQGGIGVSITNEGYAQLVSIFTICNDTAIFCGSGAACDLTNSNSSFGNFGLIADGVGPLKYTGIVTQTSRENSDTFVLDLNVPTIGISTAIYDNVSGIITAYTDEPHGFSVGMGISLSNFQFTCEGIGGIEIYPSGNKGYVFEAKTVAPGRYVDAGNLIAKNKIEIQDKALASIALNHPDFIFPGDSNSDDRYRFYDSYRLIQQNKQEIVDKALASISIGFPTGFSFPDDPVPYEQNRYYDAYRLIILNKDEIVGTAFTNTVNEPAFSGFDFAAVQEKCKRDLGFFVDAIATDVFIGGNTYARAFSLQYFDEDGNPIADGLLGEESESIYAFEQARDLMKQAITNQLSYQEPDIFTGPAEFGGGGGDLDYDDSNACSDVQQTINTLSTIVTTTIGAGNTSSLPTQNLGISTTNICARDLGYFVDAISTDVFTGGNTYSIAFTKFYFDKNGNPIIDGLLGEEAESVYSFASARDLMKKAITNQLNIKDLTLTSDPITGSNTDLDSCANVQSNINTLVGIVTQTISEGNLNTLNSITLNLGTFTDGGSKCRRDIGFLVESLSLDIRDFTNQNIRKFIKGYFDANGNPIINGIVGEIEESVTSFNAVGELSKKAINNLLNFQDRTIQIDPDTLSNVDPASCANVQTFIDNLIATVNSDSVGVATSKLNLPPISASSTVFSCNVGVSTTQNQVYIGGGEAKINVSRPFDGQVIHFGELFYTVNKVVISSGGSGYTENPVVTVSSPEVSWGIEAQAAAVVNNGSVSEFEIISNGRGYTYPPKVIVDPPITGINTATAIAQIVPTYYSIVKSTPVSSGICTITINDNVPYEVAVGTEVPFNKQSRVLASGHSLEYIGSGTQINQALPSVGGVPIQENETDARNGGLVVFTSTDQTGNFRIGDGVIINQQTGSISGTFYSKSLFSTLTPFILALGGD